MTNLRAIRHYILLEKNIMVKYNSKMFNILTIGTQESIERVLFAYCVVQLVDKKIIKTILYLN